MTRINTAADPLGTDAAVLVFELETQQFALPLRRVQRVLRSVAITPLPGAPSIVLGVVDIAGSVLPVIDMRARFGCPARAVHPSDQLVLAHTDRRSVALLVDATAGVVVPALPLA
ncbi:MAG: chemotaxis protein CheW, partial [Chloroflexota bacterium]